MESRNTSGANQTWSTCSSTRDWQDRALGQVDTFCHCWWDSICPGRTSYLLALQKPLNFLALLSNVFLQVPGCRANVVKEGHYFVRRKVCRKHCKADEICVGDNVVRCAH